MEQPRRRGARPRARRAVPAAPARRRRPRLPRSRAVRSDRLRLHARRSTQRRRGSAGAGPRGRAARRRIEERRKQGAGEAAELALQRILAAEGSDWFWWFGAPFSSAEDPIFDRLFRAHLDAVYRALGDPSPPELAAPVDDALARA